jgi:hypothetical protein
MITLLKRYVEVGRRHRPKWSHIKINLQTKHDVEKNASSFLHRASANGVIFQQYCKQEVAPIIINPVLIVLSEWKPPKRQWTRVQIVIIQTSVMVTSLPLVTVFAGLQRVT